MEEGRERGRERERYLPLSNSVYAHLESRRQTVSNCLEVKKHRGAVLLQDALPKAGCICLGCEHCEGMQGL